MKDLIISLAVSGRENYEANLPALLQSLKDNWKGDIRILRHFPEYVTPHAIIPYAFKFDLIKKALKEGYKRIVWLDSCMRLRKNPIKLLKESKAGIVAFHNYGHELSPYLSDKAFKNMQDCEVAHNYIPKKMTWGGALMFDFNKLLPQVILEKVFEQIELGSFEDGLSSSRPEFIATRHDQSVLSVLFDFYRIELLPYGLIASKKDADEHTVIQYGDN